MTNDCGYDVLVGGGLFRGYADHPRMVVDLPALKIKSTAAGRYQLLRRYYDFYKKTLGLKDFPPLSQDLIALQQFRERRALPLARPARSRKPSRRSARSGQACPARATASTNISFPTCWPCTAQRVERWQHIAMEVTPVSDGLTPFLTKASGALDRRGDSRRHCEHRLLAGQLNEVGPDPTAGHQPADHRPAVTAADHEHPARGRAGAEA